MGCSGMELRCRGDAVIHIFNRADHGEIRLTHLLSGLHARLLSRLHARLLAGLHSTWTLRHLAAWILPAAALGRHLAHWILLPRLLLLLWRILLLLLRRVLLLLLLVWRITKTVLRRCCADTHADRCYNYQGTFH